MPFKLISIGSTEVSLQCPLTGIIMLLLQPPSGCSSVSVGFVPSSGCSSLDARTACPRRANISGEVDGVANAEAAKRKIAHKIRRIGRQNLAQLGAFEKVILKYVALGFRAKLSLGRNGARPSSFDYVLRRY